MKKLEVPTKAKVTSGNGRRKEWTDNPIQHPPEKYGRNPHFLQIVFRHSTIGLNHLYSSTLPTRALNNRTGTMKTL
jgi:hypothetical protein